MDRNGSPIDEPGGDDSSAAEIAAPGEVPVAPPQRRTRWRRVAGRLLLVLTGCCGLWLLVELLTWPEVARLGQENPTTTAFMERYRAAQRRAGEEPELAWLWIPSAQISPELKRAVLVAEDINFFGHNGFETSELRAALRQAWQRRRLPRGASTITQQLAKNLWLSPSRNPLRKLKEAILTVQLERSLDKQRILELYLNVVELGPGVYGAGAAARYYFDTTAAALGRHQAAALAASLPRPRQWNPACTSRAYWRRVSRIEARIDRATFLLRLIEPAEGAGGAGQRAARPAPVR